MTCALQRVSVQHTPQRGCFKNRHIRSLPPDCSPKPLRACPLPRGGSGVFAGWGSHGWPCCKPPQCRFSGNVCRHLRGHVPGSRSAESQAVGPRHAGLQSWSQSQALLAFSNTVSALLCSLHFHIRFRINPSVSVKTGCWGLMVAAGAVKVEVCREPTPSPWGVFCSEHLEYPLVQRASH